MTDKRAYFICKNIRLSEDYDKYSVLSVFVTCLSCLEGEDPKSTLKFHLTGLPWTSFRGKGLNQNEYVSTIDP